MKTLYPGYYLAPMRWLLSMTLVCATTGCLIERDQPDLEGQDVRLTIIHTSDIHSRLFPYNFVPNTFDQDYGLLPANGPFGGLARIGTMELVTQLDNWSQFPHLVANYAFDDPANPGDVSLADVTSPFEIFDVQG